MSVIGGRSRGVVATEPTPADPGPRDGGCVNPRCTCSPCGCDDCRRGAVRLGDLERRVMEVLWDRTDREITGRDETLRLFTEGLGDDDAHRLARSLSHGTGDPVPTRPADNRLRPCRHGHEACTPDRAGFAREKHRGSRS